MTVFYDLIGFGDRKVLPPGEEVLIENVPLPRTITTVGQEDDTLIDVLPVTTSEPGLLEVTLNESQDLDDYAGVIKIQRDGEVFVN